MFFVCLSVLHSHVYCTTTATTSPEERKKVVHIAGNNNNAINDDEHRAHTHTLSQSDMVRLSVYLLCVNEIFSILICLKTKMVVAPIMMMVHKTKQYSEQSRKRRRKYSHYLEWIFSRLFSSLLYFLCICAVLATIDYTLSISPIIYWSIVLSLFIAGVENFCNFLLLSNAYNLQHFSRASIRCALNVFQLHRW